jgi:hypothetical protein
MIGVKIFHDSLAYSTSDTSGGRIRDLVFMKLGDKLSG